MSGRELFLFKPELAGDDDDEAADDPNLYKKATVCEEFKPFSFCCMINGRHKTSKSNISCYYLASRNIVIASDLKRIDSF